MSKVKDLFAKYEIGFRTYGKDVDKHFQEFEDEFNQLLIEAKINELKRAKLNSYIPKNHLHKVDRRIFELQQSLKDKS